MVFKNSCADGDRCKYNHDPDILKKTWSYCFDGLKSSNYNPRKESNESGSDATPKKSNYNNNIFDNSKKISPLAVRRSPYANRDSSVSSLRILSREDKLYAEADGNEDTYATEN
jgi:2-oxoglutarate dehydrogenase complex dehydrogenase (E1) component-like enzyme